MSRTEQPCEPSVAQMLKVSQVSRSLNMSRSAVYGLMDRGALAYVKLGKSRRIPAEALQRLVADSTIGGK